MIGGSVSLGFSIVLAGDSGDAVDDATCVGFLLLSASPRLVPVLSQGLLSGPLAHWVVWALIGEGTPIAADRLMKICCVHGRIPSSAQGGMNAGSRWGINRG